VERACQVAGPRRDRHPKERIEEARCLGSVHAHERLEAEGVELPGRALRSGPDRRIAGGARELDAAFSERGDDGVCNRLGFAQGVRDRIARRGVNHRRGRAEGNERLALHGEAETHGNRAAFLARAWTPVEPEGGEASFQACSEHCHARAGAVGKRGLLEKQSICREGKHVQEGRWLARRGGGGAKVHQSHAIEIEVVTGRVQEHPIRNLMGGRPTVDTLDERAPSPRGVDQHANALACAPVDTNPRPFAIMLERGGPFGDDAGGPRSKILEESALKRLGVELRVRPGEMMLAKRGRHTHLAPRALDEAPERSGDLLGPKAVVRKPGLTRGRRDERDGRTAANAGRGNRQGSWAAPQHPYVACVAHRFVDNGPYVTKSALDKTWTQYGQRMLKLAIGLALIAGIWLAFRRGAPRHLGRRWVERRLGGYCHDAVEVDSRLPHTEGPRAERVAVIGAGLGGIAAASTLAERGIAVTLYERNHYLGGKIGAWKTEVEGATQTVDHGFHAFFRQYYNLNRFLDRLGLRAGFRAIEDYLIIDRHGRELRFGDIETAPALNIIELGRRGFYRWRDVLPRATRDRLEMLVRFDMEQTYAALDGITFEEFCDDAALPDELRISFRTFARAFFSDEADLSTADVVRAFHFYYLSHDHGLMYDYPFGDYETTLLGPIRAHLQRHAVDIRLGTPVSGIEAGTDRRFRVDGDEYDFVVIAADIPGAQTIIGASSWLTRTAPGFTEDIRSLRTSHGYAVWRIWVDRDLRPGLPTFVNVDRKQVLDSVTLYHRITDEARDWAEARGGAVLELHSYALPKDIGDDAAVRRVFLEELEQYFPELGGLQIFAESLQVKHDFPAFAPGQRKHRPAPKTPVEGLMMAGDWVRLPFPMTHMEAAFTSGLVCANLIFEKLGLRAEPIQTVAPRGLLAPKAERLLEEQAA